MDRQFKGHLMNTPFREPARKWITKYKSVFQHCIDEKSGWGERLDDQLNAHSKEGWRPILLSYANEYLIAVMERSEEENDDVPIESHAQNKS
jgi:hypothetical protein